MRLTVETNNDSRSKGKNFSKEQFVSGQCLYGHLINNVPSNPCSWRELRMLIICWDDSMHNFIKLRTVLEELSASRYVSGVSTCILKKQNKSGRVARTMHLKNQHSFFLLRGP